MAEHFEQMLTGGHPNSLGRTVDVVEAVLAKPERFDELFACYRSVDAVVRLRTSNALKRIEARRHDLLLPYIDRLIGEIGALDQASVQWTLAQLFAKLKSDMSAAQRGAAQAVMQRNLATWEDWIVLNMTMETLSSWAGDDDGLRDWLRPHLERLADDPRKSVSAKARKALDRLER